MQFFDSLSQAADQGFAIIDYDVEQQQFVLVKKEKSYLLRVRRDSYAVVTPEQP